MKSIYDLTEKKSAIEKFIYTILIFLSSIFCYAITKLLLVLLNICNWCFYNSILFFSKKKKYKRDNIKKRI